MPSSRLLIPAGVFLVASAALIGFFAFSSTDSTGVEPPVEKKSGSQATSQPSRQIAGQVATGTGSPTYAARLSAQISDPMEHAVQQAPVQNGISSPAPEGSLAAAGRSTPATAAQSPATAAQNNAGGAPTSEPNGLVTKAQVVAGGKEYAFEPNSQGLFPRVTIGLQDTVSIAVAYPQGTVGDLVVIQSEDGGSVADGKSVIQVHLDDNLLVKFPFKSTAEGSPSQ